MADDTSEEDNKAKEESRHGRFVVKVIDLADPLICKEDAARMLLMSKWSLMRLRKQGKISYVIVMRKRLYRLSFIEGFIDKFSVMPRSRNRPTADGSKKTR